MLHYVRRTAHMLQLLQLLRHLLKSWVEIRMSRMRKLLKTYIESTSIMDIPTRHSLNFYAPVLGYRNAIGTEERSDDLGPVRVYMITLWIRRKQ